MTPLALDVPGQEGDIRPMYFRTIRRRTSVLRTPTPSLRRERRPRSLLRLCLDRRARLRRLRDFFRPLGTVRESSRFAHSISAHIEVTLRGNL